MPDELLEENKRLKEERDKYLVLLLEACDIINGFRMDTEEFMVKVDEILK